MFAKTLLFVISKTAGANLNGQIRQALPSGITFGSIFHSPPWASLPMGPSSLCPLPVCSISLPASLCPPQSLEPEELGQLGAGLPA